MLLMKTLSALAALGAVASAPVPTLDTLEYPSLSYYGYMNQPASSPAAGSARLPVVNKAAQPIEFHDASNEGAVNAKKARAALIRADGLSHKTWEVSTFFQAKAELYGVTEHNWSAKAFAAQQPGDQAVKETTYKLGSLLDIAGDGYLVDSDRGSQADVFSLVPAVWASGKQDAAKGMVNWLRSHGVRVGNAYSHRGDRQSLWSDEGYMIPPVLAFLGLVQDDTSLLSEALSQWNSVADALADDKGTFRHVPSEFDPHAWTSGTGWMLMGLARVFASITEAGHEDAYTDPINAAKEKARRALFAAFGAQTDDGRIPNYSDRDSPAETAGTAAVTAAYYRLLLQHPETFGDEWLFAAAEKAYKGVMAQVGEDGTVNGCVDPSGNDFNNANISDSPEGHAFVPLMWAARNAWLGHYPDGKLPQKGQATTQTWAV